MNLHCPQCNTNYRSSSKFCPKCGCSLKSPHKEPIVEINTCFNCGFLNKAFSLFCGKCGVNFSNPKPPPIEEKLTNQESSYPQINHKTEDEETLKNLNARIQELKAEVEVLDEQAHLQSFGFYKPRYDFESSQVYSYRLKMIRSSQKEMIKDKTAAICLTEWVVDGSRVEGRKKTNQMLRLMLRAFNGEADAAILKVRYNNVYVMEKKD